jgi:cephalosporin-C deacetylase-like acetyl esterase
MQEKVFIKNKKGLKLATIIERPKNKGKYPTVLLFHGFKGYKEEPQYSELAKELLKNSIASVRFDASGYGESEGEFKKDYRLTSYIKDANMIYEFIIQKGWVDDERIGVMGHSLGAAIVLIIASISSRIKAVVSVSTPNTVTMRNNLFRKIFKWLFKGYVEIKTSKENENIKIPFCFAVDAMKYDIKKYAKKVKVNKLFISGLCDVTVAPDQTKEVFESANEPKKLIKYKKMRHDYKNQPEVLKKVNREIVNFFVENI